MTESLTQSMYQVPEKHYGFGWAVDALKEGRRVARKGWNSRGMHIELYKPERIESQPYVRMKTVEGTWVPWQPSHTDMLGQDWELISG